jgi:6-phosphofructokinase 1
VVGIPGSIDNDIRGTDMSIGVDTALNTALEAIDRIKDTASSHQRAFLIEVMGRECGYLALMTGIAGGAEMILLPEVETPLEDVAKGIADAYIRGKAHGIIVVAEGYKPGTVALLDYFKENRADLGFKVRATVLGHVQRGGAPTSLDRILATRLGAGAINQLAEGNAGVMVGLRGVEVEPLSLEESTSERKPLDLRLLDLAKVMEK